MSQERSSLQYEGRRSLQLLWKTIQAERCPPKHEEYHVGIRDVDVGNQIMTMPELQSSAPVTIPQTTVELGVAEVEQVEVAMVAKEVMGKHQRRGQCVTSA